MRFSTSIGLSRFRGKLPAVTHGFGEIIQSPPRKRPSKRMRAPTVKFIDQEARIRRAKKELEELLRGDGKSKGKAYFYILYICNDRFPSFSTVSTTNVKAKATTPNKKRRVAPIVSPSATPTPVDEPTPTSNPISSIVDLATPTRSASADIVATTRKEDNPEENDAMEKLAPPLFGANQQSTTRQNPESEAPPFLSELTLYSSQRNATQPSPTAIPYAPRQVDYQQHIFYPQAPRQEGYYYGPHHPAQFYKPYPYSSCRGPSAHCPCCWNGRSGMEWYPPAPSNATYYSAPSAPMNGHGNYLGYWYQPGYWPHHEYRSHPGYWQHAPPFPNQYDRYLPQGTPPIYHHQNSTPRGHGYSA